MRKIQGLIAVTDDQVHDYFKQRRDFTMLSAFRGDKSEVENSALLEDMCNAIDAAGFSYLRLIQLFVSNGVERVQTLLYIENMYKGKTKVSADLEDGKLLEELVHNLSEQFQLQVFLHHSSKKGWRRFYSNSEEFITSDVEDFAQVLRDYFLPTESKVSSFYFKEIPGTLMGRHAVLLKTGEDFIGPSTLKRINTINLED